MLVGFTVLRTMRDGAAVPAPVTFAVGQCVPAPGAAGRVGLDCGSPEAFGKVTATVPGTGGAECPIDTDEVLTTTAAAATACVRALRPPHAGDPGQGGGVIRVGDCVGNPGTGRTAEQPCARRGYYGQVVARVDTASQCASPAAEAVSLIGAAHPVFCLAPRATTGSCLGQAVVGPPDPVVCTDPHATGRILARVGQVSACPTGTASTVQEIFGLPASRVVCLARPG